MFEKIRHFMPAIVSFIVGTVISALIFSKLNWFKVQDSNGIVTDKIDVKKLVICSIFLGLFCAFMGTLLYDSYYPKTYGFRFDDDEDMSETPNYGEDEYGEDEYGEDDHGDLY